MNGAQIFGVCIAAVVAAWVVSDAMRRDISSGTALLWGLGVFALLIVFLPMYLFLRSESGKSELRTSTLCQYCGLYNEGSPAYCPHCGKQLKSATEIHSHLN